MRDRWVVSLWFWNCGLTNVCDEGLLIHWLSEASKCFVGLFDLDVSESQWIFLCDEIEPVDPLALLNI